MRNCILSLIVMFAFVNLSFSQNDIEKFNEDVRLKEIAGYAKSFSSLKPTETDKINSLRVKIDKLVKDIHLAYGEENVKNYIAENLRAHHSLEAGDGNKCKRNSDGTVNTDACSTWEFVAYVFSAAMHCGPGEPTDFYYNCCQAAVCRNC